MAISLMENGSYKVNVYMGADASRYVAYADSKHEAEILETEAKLKKLKGEVKKKKGSYTFKEVYQMWWNKKYTVTQHHEQSTLDRTKTCFEKRILPYLGGIPINKITYDLLEDTQILWAFGNEEKGIKPYANYKHCVSYTKQVLRYALVKGYIQKNPYDLLEMPVNADLKNKKEEKRQQKYYSKELIQQVLTLMEQEYGVQDHTLLSLIYQLGAAKGEIYPLVWSDIDFKNKTISLMHKLVKNKATGKYERVRGMKNSYRFRTIPVADSVIDLLAKWKKVQFNELQQVNIFPTDDQFIFTYTTQKGELNQPLHPDYLNNKLDALSKKFGLSKITPHGLRHTFVSDLLNNGVDDLIVKSLVGHAETSEITRNVYGHVNPEVQKETVKHLEDYRQKTS